MASRGILLLIAVFSLLMLQAGNAIVFAEQAGLTCHLDEGGCGSHESNHESEPKPNSKEDSNLPKNSPNGDQDSKCSCASVVLICEVPCLAFVPACVSVSLSVTDDDSRDSLPRAIDYPPQLG